MSVNYTLSNIINIVDKDIICSVLPIEVVSINRIRANCMLAISNLLNLK